jgi:2-alkenal reductase
VAALTILVTMLACGFLPNLDEPVPQANPVVTLSPEQESEPAPVNPQAPGLIAQQDILVNLYQAASPGVVSIRVLTEAGEALGSGFLYDSQGHIITNYHVVEGFSDFEIDFSSGLKVRGEVIGTDLDSDLAVIKVDVPADQLTPLPLGDSSQVMVGQSVVAIGNPFGLSGTMTVGIVSAKGRTLPSLHAAPGGSPFTAGDIIQTDTAINPGNSGGPLLNLNGEVIGVNRAIRTESFNTGGEPVNSGIGFAVSIDMVKRVAPELIANGEYAYPYLGISSFDEISLLLQEALDLPQATGAYVSEVTADSPAERAGLVGGTEPTDLPGVNAGGDLIIAIDGVEVRTFGEMLSYLINNKSPGDTVTMTVLRDGERMDLPLVLDRRP